MKAYRKIALFLVLALMLSLTMALPVSAAKPEQNDCGILCITTSGEDTQLHMAVCIAEEDGNFVYSGNRPIQQQLGLYASVTRSKDFNSFYEIQEDTGYAAQGIYRFALGEVSQGGSEADFFPRMEAASRGDTIYFVTLDTTEAELYVVEKTTVASVGKGTLTTKDSLEKDLGNGDFSVIFNDSGNVVGFCKSGVITAPMSTGGISSTVIWIGAAVLALGLGAALVVLVLKKKPPKEEKDNSYQWAQEDTSLEDSCTQLIDDFQVAAASALVLKCHGGALNGRVYPIGAEGITFGRDPANTIRYSPQTPGISRRHAKLFWSGTKLMLLDEGSSNGTYLNRTGKISPMRPVPLNPGDIFFLGEKKNGFEIAYK